LNSTSHFTTHHQENAMAGPAGKKDHFGMELLDISVFKDVQIRFPGDVYIMAVWLAMSDRSKRTPTFSPRTTVRGLANHLVSLCNGPCTNRVDAEAIIQLFERHGITRKGMLDLGETVGEDAVQLAIDDFAGRPTAAAPRIAEPAAQKAKSASSAPKRKSTRPSP